MPCCVLPFISVVSWILWRGSGSISPLDVLKAVKFIHHFTTKKHGEIESIAAYHIKQNGLERMDMSKT